MGDASNKVSYNDILNNFKGDIGKTDITFDVHNGVIMKYLGHITTIADGIVNFEYSTSHSANKYTYKLKPDDDGEKVSLIAGNGEVLLPNVDKNEKIAMRRSTSEEEEEEDDNDGLPSPEQAEADIKRMRKEETAAFLKELEQENEAKKQRLYTDWDAAIAKDRYETRKGQLTSDAFPDDPDPDDPLDQRIMKELGREFGPNLKKMSPGERAAYDEEHKDDKWQQFANFKTDEELIADWDNRWSGKRGRKRAFGFGRSYETDLQAQAAQWAVDVAAHRNRIDPGPELERGKKIAVEAIRDATKTALTRAGRVNGGARRKIKRRKRYKNKKTIKRNGRGKRNSIKKAKRRSRK